MEGDKHDAFVSGSNLPSCNNSRISILGADKPSLVSVAVCTYFGSIAASANYRPQGLKCGTSFTMDWYSRNAPSTSQRERLLLAYCNIDAAEMSECEPIRITCSISGSLPCLFLVMWSHFSQSLTNRPKLMEASNQVKFGPFASLQWSLIVQECLSMDSSQVTGQEVQLLYGPVSPLPSATSPCPAHLFVCFPVFVWNGDFLCKLKETRSL